MPKAYALHIALNSVDPKKYNGNSGFLSVCENDALRYAQIALEQEFDYIKMLMGKNATKGVFRSLMIHFCSVLQEEDFLLLTFSGHGGQQRDTNGDEPDQKDETWCFYDGQLLDDELFEIWSAFKTKTRIFVISDSCHSGAILKGILPFNPFQHQQVLLNEGSLARSAAFQKPVPKIKASVRLIAAAKEGLIAFQGAKNSRFTRILLEVWNHGEFTGNYLDFFDTIRRKISDQHPPVHAYLGYPNPDFDLQTPFTF